MVAGAVFLAGHELVRFQQAFRPAQLHVNALRVHPFHDAGQDLVFLLDVFIVDLALFHVLKPLADHLLGGLGGHAAKIRRGHVQFHDVAQFIIGPERSGVLQGNLLVFVLHFFGNHLAGKNLHVMLPGQHHGKVHGRVGPTFHIFAVGGLAALLHRADDLFHADILGLGQGFDGVHHFRFACHSFLLPSKLCRTTVGLFLFAFFQRAQIGHQPDLGNHVPRQLHGFFPA